MKYQTDSPCIICGKVTENGNCLHHLMTKKAFPEFRNASWNLIPCDMLCHTKYFHLKGLSWTAERFPKVKDWLIENGWEYSDFKKKWIHV